MPPAIVVSDLSRQLTCHVGWNSPLGKALVFRAWPLRSLHVVGDTPMAGALRGLIAAGAALGWELHPVPGGRTALHVLAAPLYRLSGQQGFYNLLDRAGFAWAEEVAATPEVCLLELRNSGPKFIAAVRRAVSELGIDGASVSPEGTGQRRDPGQASSPPAVPAEVARALHLVARWAVAERGASTFGDLLTLAPGIAELPPEVARSWDRIGQLGLQALTGTAPAGRGLPELAGRLLGEVADDRRRLILTCRTFAAQRRTYDSLAAEFGVSRGRVRQPETSALQQLAHAAAEDLRPAAMARSISSTRRRRSDGRSTRCSALDGTAAFLAGGQDRLTRALSGSPPVRACVLSHPCESSRTGSAGVLHVGGTAEGARCPADVSHFAVSARSRWR